MLPALALSQPVPGALQLFAGADKGRCIACHQLPEGVGAATRADVGPKLDGARMRELGRERIRQAIEDPMRANPGTVMPPYGRHRILSPDEITRLTDFLHALP
jgi:L-cysteine S-thiosulfotransferase